MGVIDYSIRRRVAALEARDGSVVDLGVIRSIDLLANGPTLIYTPSGSDYVEITHGLADFQAIDHQIITCGQLNAGKNQLLAPDLTNPNFFPGRGRPYTTEPVVAQLQTDVSGYEVDTAPLSWASTHLYGAVSIIHGPDAHLWSSGAGGTSGGSTPNFAANEGGTVVDGSVTWTDEGHVPTTGTVHVYAIVTPLG